MKESIYIIGGSGFIGKHLAVFLSKDYDVTVFDKFIDRDYFSQFIDIKIIEIDLVNTQIPQSFPSPSFILNLAATLVTASRNLDHLDVVIAENVSILMNLFNRFRNEQSLKLLVQFGSLEEYGNGASPYLETQREMPNSTYGILKQTTTNLALMLHSNEGFPALVVRPGNLFGKYQHEQRFIPYVYHQLSRNEAVEVTGCEQKRDFIYIDDFVTIIGKIILKYDVFVGEIVNISSGESLSLKHMIERMKQLLSSTSDILYGKIPYREHESMDLKCQIIKLEKLLDEPLTIHSLERIKDYVAIMSTNK